MIDIIVKNNYEIRCLSKNSYLKVPNFLINIYMKIPIYLVFINLINT